ncbi:MAG: cell division protein FtsQ [Flavobacterium sp.]|nr:cell division protein FtsQ [Flavobacterium sp.]
MKKYFKWNNVRLILMFGLILFLYSFTSLRNEHRKLVKSDIVITGDGGLYIPYETVNKLLIENKNHVTAIEKEQLDLNKLEKALNNHSMIEKSEVFVTVDGVLKAVVKQKTPVVRVIDETGSFYIDYQGDKMPLSEIQSARIPLVSGPIELINSGNLHELFRIIYDDDFLRKNIIGIEVMQNGSIRLANRNYDYVIDFGSAKSIKRKFENYKAFFQKASADNSLEKYKKVNLKFTQQVVCTK